MQTIKIHNYVTTFMSASKKYIQTSKREKEPVSWFFNPHGATWSIRYTLAIENNMMSIADTAIAQLRD